MKLSQEFINQVELKIIPHIVEAVTESREAFEKSSFFDNYMFGCSCWNNIFNRLPIHFPDEFFHITCYNKVIKITALNDAEELNFYISKVDEYTRIPKGAKSLKIYMQEQLFLSEEIKNIITHDKKTIYMIGYSASTNNGIDKITFDMLSAIGKNKYQAETLYVFESRQNNSVEEINQQIEIIKQPIVTKETLHISKKEVKK